jgi:hypothetical protein
VVAGLIAMASLSGPSLPASDKMSENFKKAAYEPWISFHEWGMCTLPSEVKPENTADQQVRDLFDQCFEIDSKKLGFSGKLMTDDLKSKYNDLNDEQAQIKQQMDRIFEANGYEDADTTLRKRMEEKLNPKKVKTKK